MEGKRRRRFQPSGTYEFRISLVGGRALCTATMSNNPIYSQVIMMNPPMTLRLETELTPQQHHRLMADLEAWGAWKIPQKNSSAHHETTYTYQWRSGEKVRKISFYGTPTPAQRAFVTQVYEKTLIGDFSRVLSQALLTSTQKMHDRSADGNGTP